MVGFFMQLAGAFFIGIFCSIILEAPVKTIFYAAIISMGGWAVYLLCADLWGFSEPVSTYFSGLLIAGLSHYFARTVHEPVTLFFIPGFFTLVPGGGMYRTALEFIQGNNNAGFQEFGTTLFIALAIALAVFTVDSMMKVINKQVFPKFVRKNKHRIYRHMK